MGVKISTMTAASALSGAEKVEVTQSGNTRYTTTQDIADQFGVERGVFEMENLHGAGPMM